MKELILKYIEANAGIKSVDLVIKIMENINPSEFLYTEYTNAVMQLLLSGEITELEYTLPHMEWRIKSMYFPKGTVFTNQS